MDKKASTRAWQWRLLGISILLTDFLLVYYLGFVLGIDNSLVRQLLITSGPFLTVLCFYRARRYSARVELDTRHGQPAKEDSRPPVVYLRSFNVDDKGASTLSALRSQTEEELLASLFSEIGPFLALGKPHERLPTLGAYRLYVEDDEWERVVSDLMLRARLVVLRTGETEGLLWEVQRAARKVLPENLLLLVPCGKKSYETFRGKAQPFFLRPLPDYPTWKIPPTNLQGVIVFESDWTARFLPFKAGLLRGNFSDPSCSWRTGLRPVYERLRIPWRSPPINRMRVAFVIVIAAGLLFAASERLRERYRTPTPGEISYLRFVEHVEAAPEFQPRAARSFPAEPYIFARILTTKGLHRLSNESLVHYVSLHRRLLEAAEEEACAHIAWGIANPREIGESFERMSPAEVDQWLALSEKAALSELRQAPPIQKLDERQLTEARDRLLQGLWFEEAELLRTGVPDFGEGGAEKSCRTARALFAKADETRGRLRTPSARAVVALFH